MANKKEFCFSTNESIVKVNKDYYKAYEKRYSQVYENNMLWSSRDRTLEVKEIIAPISARLIGNKASFKFKTKEIENIIKRLGELVKND